MQNEETQNRRRQSVNQVPYTSQAVHQQRQLDADIAELQRQANRLINATKLLDVAVMPAELIFDELQREGKILGVWGKQSHFSTNSKNRRNVYMDYWLSTEGVVDKELVQEVRERLLGALPASTGINEQSVYASSDYGGDLGSFIYVKLYMDVPQIKK
jgi:hypothetical protein